MLHRTWSIAVASALKNISEHIENRKVPRSRAQRRKLYGQTAPGITLEPRIVFSISSLIERSNAGIGPHLEIDPPVALPPSTGTGSGVTGAAASAAPFALSDTFALHSSRTSTKVIYLDFNGVFTTNTAWNSDQSVIVTPPFDLDGNADTNFTTDELSSIQRIWQRVSEAFIAFDVDVTTEKPSAEDLNNSGGADTRWGTTVAIGGSDQDVLGIAAGGVAYVGTFGNAYYSPAFAFSADFGGNEKGIADVIVHEVGHNLGLSHDGRKTTPDPEEYYAGHGSGQTGWAPVMGVGYYRDLVQWSKGEYPLANNQQDDLAIITSQNGFGYRTDDYGNSASTAATLPASVSGAVSVSGIITLRSDSDWFRIQLPKAGIVNFTANTAPLGTMLDIQLGLIDSNGDYIASSNPIDGLSASLTNISLAAGVYYVRIDGVGKFARGTDYGYTDYSSIGSYTITGRIDITNTEPPQITTTQFSILETATLDTVVGTVRATTPISYQTNTFSLVSQSMTGAFAFAIDPSTGVLTLKNPGALDLRSRSYIDLTIKVTDSAAVPLSSTSTVRVNITDVLPAIVSFNPDSANTVGASTQVFILQFNQRMTGLSAADFQVVTAGTVATNSSVQVVASDASENSFRISVTGVTGNGTAGLRLLDRNTIFDVSGNPLKLQAQPPVLTTVSATPAPTGTNQPYAVRSADVNSDGKLDLVSVDRLSSAVLVSLGNGNGTFGPASMFATGPLPTSLSVVDINSDGKLDVVTANSLGNGVSVLLGNGNGSFRQALNVARGSNRIDVLAVDVNNDGKVDLVTVNADSAQQNSTASVFLNRGSGTFSAGMTLATGGTPAAVASGDFNGDGVADLVITNSRSNSASVYLGAGDGTFSASGTITTGATPQGVTIADFDGDGKADVAIANSGSGTATVVFGKGDGTFEGSLSLGAGTTPRSLVATDLNNDGRIDLAVADSGAGAIVSLMGNGGRTFASAVSQSVSGVQPLSLTTGDFNGDGRPDLAFAASSGSGIRVLLNSPTSSFAAAPTLSTPQSVAGGTNPYGVTTADMNGDGLPDIVSADNANARVGISLNLGNGTFGTRTTYVVGTNPRNIIAADLNRDGKIDIVTADQSGNTLSVLLGNGDGTLQPRIAVAAGTGPVSLVAADLNGDGKLDLVATNFGRNTATVLLGNGDGTFRAGTVLATGLQPFSVAAGDVNSDGRQDLVVTNFAGKNASVFLGNGNGTFQTPTTVVTGINPRGVVIADLDRDGKADLVIANAGSNTVGVFLGNGNGGFRAPVEIAVANTPQNVVVGDFNRDGLADIAVVSSGGGSVSILAGKSLGAFQPDVVVTGLGSPTGVAAADLDRDGRLDLVTSGPGSPVSVLLNTSKPGYLSGIQQVGTGLSSSVAAARASATPAVEQVSLTFSQDITGLVVASFGMTKNGTVVSLAGQSLQQISSRQYILSLGHLATGIGSYALTLNRTTVASTSLGNIGNGLTLRWSQLS